jgi:hypothetical protein
MMLEVSNPIIGSAPAGRSENIFATFFENQRY